jgi:hypothetical protein
MLVIEPKTELFARFFKDVEGDFHDFRPDTITGKNCKFECFHKIWKKRSNLPQRLGASRLFADFGVSGSAAFLLRLEKEIPCD